MAWKEVKQEDDERGFHPLPRPACLSGEMEDEEFLVWSYLQSTASIYHITMKQFHVYEGKLAYLQIKNDWNRIQS